MSQRYNSVVVIPDEDDSDLEIIENDFFPFSKAPKITPLRSLPTSVTTPLSNNFQSHADTSPAFASHRLPSSPSPSSSSSSHGVANQGGMPLFTSNWSFSALNRSPTPQANSSSISTSVSHTISPTAAPTSPPTMARGTASTPFDLTDHYEAMEVDALYTCAYSLRRPVGNSASDLADEDEDLMEAIRQSLLISNSGIPTGDEPVYLTINDGEECPSQPSLAHSAILIDLEELEDSDAAEQEKALSESYNRRRPNAIPRRNPSVAPPFRAIDECVHIQFKLRRNKTVELVDGDLLRIQNIIVNDHTGEIKLIGNQLQRQKDMNGRLVRLVNEVVLCFEVDLDDARDPRDQAVIEIPLSRVVKLRSVRFSNHLIENFRHTNPAQLQNMAVAQAEGGLTARWKYTTYFLSAAERRRNTGRNREWALERIKCNEASANCSISEASLRFRWRGETVLGGSYRPNPNSLNRNKRRPAGSRNQPIDLDFQDLSASVPERKRRRESGSVEAKRARLMLQGGMEETRRRLSGVHLPAAHSRKESLSITTVVDLTMPPASGEILQPQNLLSSRQRPNSRAFGQKFTFGDAFCGAGGTTRGAEMADLKVRWGFDKEPIACETWSQNFTDAECYQMEAFEFNDRFKYTQAKKVDILHMSPPCQFFSPAHTRAGPEDEDNSASLFAVLEIIERAKPRVVTLEQTFGLFERANCRMYFNALIHMFTKANFSVRWAIVPLQAWGLPARRSRLVMIASCPGEILPRIPLPTHSENGEQGLKPFVSVYQAISRLGPNPNLDRPIKWFTESQIAHSQDKKYPIQPYDGNKYLPKAITCGGGGNWHPSGKRDFTLKEYAALQGFPPAHKFCGNDTAIKKQIGNAVPPVVAKMLFESIIKDLNEADGVVDHGHIHIE